ncbi:stage II sporulation protein D [Paenibacillus sp. PAMC21692]|uniref:stage II sporulation protein D n=1 Tax=Paenibacillus sp. PAMC21692 TaxID=2762320 RepID=UPI0021C266F1|nr:stage II sporulation protein D [Paenibacillus sp. PAMC21692]
MRWFLTEESAEGKADMQAMTEARGGFADDKQPAFMSFADPVGNGKLGQAVDASDDIRKDAAASDMAEKPGTHAGAVPVVESEDRGKQPTDREAGSPGMVSKGATGDVSPPETSQQAPEDVTSVGKSPKQAEPAVKGALEGVTVRVYLTGTGTVEKVPIETYVMGVLAGEMPIDFELEALKAQAIAARTYIVRRLASGDNELASRGADVSDTVEHQVYVSKKELGRRWEGEAEAENLAKLAQAVRETEGLVVTYEGEPIQAAFFSTSNGYTENSEEYWTMSLPYLRSVDSPWDKSISPRYEQEETFELSRFYKLMGMKGKKAKGKPSIKLVDKTEGNRIKSISVNGTAFTGREVRERLGLASSQFSWKIGKEGITFTTYGFGHGVGMSQWGANGMAKEGRTAVDILLHYYSGTKVEQASNLP